MNVISLTAVAPYFFEQDVAQNDFVCMLLSDTDAPMLLCAADTEAEAYESGHEIGQYYCRAGRLEVRRVVTD